MCKQYSWTILVYVKQLLSINNNIPSFSRTILGISKTTAKNDDEEWRVFLSSPSHALTCRNEVESHNSALRSDMWNICTSLTSSVDSRLHYLGSRSQLVPQDSQPLMGQCLPNQQAREFWENHSGRPGRDANFSMAWHFRLLFIITTHHIASHGRVSQDGRLCNV